MRNCVSRLRIFHSGMKPFDRSGDVPHVSEGVTRAAEHFDAGRRTEALEIFRASVEAGEPGVSGYSLFGSMLFDHGEYSLAATAYAQILASDPECTIAHYNLGLCQASLDDWHAAERSFRRAADGNAALGEPRLALAVAQLHNARPHEALLTIETFLCSDPANELAHLCKSTALHQLGRQTEALQGYRKVLSSNPHSVDALANLLCIFREMGDRDAVRSYGPMLLEVEPDSGIALESMASAYFAEENFAAAISYVQALTTLDPSRYEHWFNLGLAHHSLGNLQEAAHAYEKATQLRGVSSRAHVNLGTVRFDLGDLHGAKRSFETALDIEGPEPSLLWNLGAVFARLDDPEQAERIYSRIPEDAPQWPNAQMQLGNLAFQRGDYGVAAGRFEACAHRLPDCGDAWCNAGIAYALLGDTGQARRHFQEVLALTPGSHEALRGLADLAVGEEDYDTAYDRYCDLLESGDCSPECRYNLGLVCQQRGLLEDAVAFYQEALQDKPDFTDALINLGHALLSLGEEQAARGCWQQAIRQRPELGPDLEAAIA